MVATSNATSGDSGCPCVPPVAAQEVTLAVVGRNGDGGGQPPAPSLGPPTDRSGVALGGLAFHIGSLHSLVTRLRPPAVRATLANVYLAVDPFDLTDRAAPLERAIASESSSIRQAWHSPATSRQAVPWGTASARQRRRV